MLVWRVCAPVVVAAVTLIGDISSWVIARDVLVYLEVLNEELRRLIGSNEPGGSMWATTDIGQVRLVAQCAAAAQEVGDLTSMRTLRLRRQPSSSESNVWAVQLSGDRQLTITFKDGNTPMTAVLDLKNGTPR